MNFMNFLMISCFGLFGPLILQLFLHSHLFAEIQRLIHYFFESRLIPWVHDIHCFALSGTHEVFSVAYLKKICTNRSFIAVVFLCQFNYWISKKQNIIWKQHIIITIFKKNNKPQIKNNYFNHQLAIYIHIL